MPTSHLTKTAVADATVRPQRYDLFDTKLKGFGVRITPNGVKTFFVVYRPGDGGRTAAKKRYTIGRFGTLTVEEARSAAQVYLANVRLGADPATDRNTRRATITVQELADRFLQAHVEAKRKATTAALYSDILNRIVLPRFGKAKVDGLTRADLAQLHADCAETPFQANRMLAVVGSMYGVGAKLGFVPEGYNPAKGIDRYPEHGRERYLGTKEVERLLEVIQVAEDEGLAWETQDDQGGAKHLPTNPDDRRTKLSPHAAAALRLLIYTGARLREILHLRWSEVDLERGTLFLSDSKTGRKPIMLNDAAATILRDLKQVGTYVIPGDDPKHPRHDLKRPWAAVSKAAGLEGVRLHDLRHTFASFAAASGLSLPIIGRLLGHTNAKTTQRYAHLSDAALRLATEAIGTAIQGKAKTPKPKPANDDLKPGAQKRSR
ncbi:tyrosine-type recombinase/integrase [Phenylobacterium sp.]|uniref:tyrosine-type recombinase/integrase n=1 Tax=Phenylobacterium sp. TaxID=1871053 RepID=UPI0030F49166